MKTTFYALTALTLLFTVATIDHAAAGNGNGYEDGSNGGGRADNSPNNSYNNSHAAAGNGNGYEDGSNGGGHSNNSYNDGGN